MGTSLSEDSLLEGLQCADDVDHGTGVVAEDVTLCQRPTEAVDIVEFGHFNVGVTDLAGRVSITAGALEHPVLLGEGKRLGIRAAEPHGTRVEDLDDVDLWEEL